MLALPNKGIARSINVHNIDLNILCDWIEASVVFDETELSKSDVIDVLIEEQIYESQSFAAQIVDDAWSIISQRINYLSSPLGITVTSNRISRVEEWDQFSAYGFCLALSCVELYSGLPAPWGGNYISQGDLFEELTAESLRKTLQGWSVSRIGWSATTHTISLATALPTIISDLNELMGAEAQLHLTKTVKDLGLDLLAFYSFADRQASMPVLLVQCASGSDWIRKRKTPDIGLWSTKIISCNSKPVRGFAIPFAFADPLKFRRDAAIVEGVFIDRYRLLKSFRQNNSSVSVALSTKLENWIRPHIVQLPRAA